MTVFNKRDGKKKSSNVRELSPRFIRIPMQNPQQQSNQPFHKNYDEEILVIKCATLFQNHSVWQGINSEISKFMPAITTQGCFMHRAHAETNTSFKQIIPYMIFMFEKKLFVMQRKSNASEQRLAGKFSLGIGGHIRQEDILNNNIIDWATREFEEEVTYHGSKRIEIIGILNDDSNPVGQVHLGLILLVHADSDQISINDEHKSGVLLTRHECINLMPRMENWSQICLQFLLDNNIL